MSNRTLRVDGVEYDIPDPDDVHYSARPKTLLNARVGKEYWLHEAQRALLFELAEEISDGHYRPGSPLWGAKRYLKAFEMMENADDIAPAIKIQLIQDIEDGALYGYAGYESAEEWFASESSLRKGGYQSDLRWWGNYFIPWCKQQEIFEDEETADRWFFTPVNSDGSSRQGALRDATSDLRDITERNVYDLPPSEQRLIVQNILRNVADPTLTRQEKKAKLNEVRNAKMEISIYRNGDGKWHVYGDLTDHQRERLERDLQFSAIIKLVEAPEGE